MSRPYRSTRLLLWTLALAILAVRASDTHLHLCFDGQEAPTTVHVADASVHHDDHREEENHADKDLDPFVGAFFKSADSDSEIALPASVVVLVLLLPKVRDAPPVVEGSLTAAVGPPFHLRPPLRGPPA